MYIVHIYYRAPEKQEDSWYPERWGGHYISKEYDNVSSARNVVKDALDRGLWIQDMAGESWVKATWAYLEWVEEEIEEVGEL